VASDGSKGPKPYNQHQASTIFLRVPIQDWNEVKLGYKTEFKGQPGMVSGLAFVEPPTPVVAYSYSRTHGYDRALMVLEDRYQVELLGATPEALAREGHQNVAHYRRYMVRREGKRFNPLLMVTAYMLRPWRAEDRAPLADRLLEHLYGDFLPEPARS